jgi:poly-gamma-glutamate synthesis protein (capsule biosynthesis protein)
MKTRSAVLALLISSSVTLFAQERITLLFAGDLMQHREQLVAARQPGGGYDYTPCFALVKPQIEAADLAIANFETTLGGKPYTGYPAFSSPDEYLYAIRDAGFDILLTANNHCLDRRQKGLERTLLMLDSLHIPHLGTYRNEQERSEHHPLFIRKNGFRLAFLNYTYGTNGIEVTPPNVVNYIDKRVMQQDIRKAKAWQPDVIIACMHWGYEYRTTPNSEQRELADWLFEQGVTHIIGSHPHVLQPFEWRTDSCSQNRQVVVYSLGNYLSNMSKVNTDGGMMFTLVLEKDTAQTASAEVRVVDSRYDLVWTARPTLSKQRNYVLYPVDSAAVSTLPPPARQRVKLFERNARRILK